MKIQNVEDLRLLVEAASTGSLTAAAQVLKVTPATASSMLKRLEGQLGVRLFERSTRSIRLTSQGQNLLGYASRALALIDEGEAQLLSENFTLSGMVRVAAPSDLARSVLLPWFDEFLAANPDLRLGLSVSDRVHDVLRDPVDVALRYGATTDPNAVVRGLAMTRRVLCASRRYLERFGTPQTPEDLRRHNCLIFELRSTRYVDWRFERDGEWVNVQVAGDREVDDASIAHQWALAGEGVLYKSELDLFHSLASGQLVRLLPQWSGEHYPLNAVFPSNRFMPQRVRGVVDFIADRLAELPILQSLA
jgi:DNA-binding transcriptional LysR family regulator